MVPFCRHIWSDELGQDIAEYAVMLAAILVVVIGTAFGIGSLFLVLLFFFSLELLQPKRRVSIASITDRMPGSEPL